MYESVFRATPKTEITDVLTPFCRLRSISLNRKKNFSGKTEDHP